MSITDYNFDYLLKEVTDRAVEEGCNYVHVNEMTMDSTAGTISQQQIAEWYPARFVKDNHSTNEGYRMAVYDQQASLNFNINDFDFGWFLGTEGMYIPGLTWKTNTAPGSQGSQSADYNSLDYWVSVFLYHPLPFRMLQAFDKSYMEDKAIQVGGWLKSGTYLSRFSGYPWHKADTVMGTNGYNARWDSEKVDWESSINTSVLIPPAMMLSQEEFIKAVQQEVQQTDDELLYNLELEKVRRFLDNVVFKSIQDNLPLDSHVADHLDDVFDDLADQAHDLPDTKYGEGNVGMILVAAVQKLRTTYKTYFEWMSDGHADSLEHAFNHHTSKLGTGIGDIEINYSYKQLHSDPDMLKHTCIKLATYVFIYRVLAEKAITSRQDFGRLANRFHQAFTGADTLAFAQAGYATRLKAQTAMGRPSHAPEDTSAGDLDSPYDAMMTRGKFDADAMDDSRRL
jgi:hypothetical protein